MKKQILISLILLGSNVTMNAQALYDTGDKVGIGTTTPSATLSVFGGISKLTTTGYDRNFDNLIKYGVKSDLESGTPLANRWHGIDATITAGGAADNKLKFRLYGGGYGNGEPIDVMTLLGNGNVGIGTSEPREGARIIIKRPIGGTSIIAADEGGYGSLILNGCYNSEPGVGQFNNIVSLNNNNNGHVILASGGGNVGIGTVKPEYRLDVCGTIRAKEVKVDLLGTCVPDFVFKSDYKLTDLKTLEQFVKTNQHLPEIASEKEMVENGVNMKELQMKLLQKMEEMTLYIIEQNKKLEQQNSEIQAMKSEIKEMKGSVK
jgi:hypothetical protein